MPIVAVPDSYMPAGVEAMNLLFELQKKARG